ncbi:DUF3168 domain-containing protein [Epibacterium ulvae]|uniref:DUF3168 domain-containing protein n=1 Tax=Epibacterium ulvae TaxID=1156985 RepID=UPI00249013DD|nr:DUF3168 domain-containing protein [Epibacterium ulvae]
MTYALSADLQTSIYELLQSDTGVSSLSGDAIYDALPTGTLPETYVVFGGEEVRDRSDQTTQGALHLITLRVVTQAAGFSQAKALAGAISTALTDTQIALPHGRVVGQWFDRATARLLKTGGREIVLRFRIQVEDSSSL